MFHLGQLLPRHARFRKNHTALIVGSERYTFGEFNVYVNKMCSVFRELGLRKGDKFTTILPNCVELVAAYWAAAKSGAVIVPSSNLLRGDALATLMSDSESKLVLADEVFADDLAGVSDRLPLVRGRMVLVRPRKGGPGKPTPRGFVDFGELHQRASAAEPPDPKLGLNDVYNIMYSSGTTGMPKGIIHTHLVRIMYCTLFASAWRMTPESVVLHSGSIVFNGSMLDFMPWMFLGCTYVLHESFNAERVIQTIETEGVTHTIMVPAQIIQVLGSPAFAPPKLQSLEMLQNVGAPLHLEFKKRLNEVLPGVFYELYGLTEGFVSILDKHDAKRKEGSVGCPSPFFDMKIIREDGSECAPGEPGQIIGRGPILMPEYHNRPEKTREALQDGWLHTGDGGYVDEDGYLFLAGRLKDMIITGGVNVYPKEIEEILLQHPGVREAAVFGAEDRKWGEVPIAAVVLKSKATAEELMTWTNDKVGAKFQRIRDVVFLDEFPRNVAGKTLKREIRADYEEAAKLKAAKRSKL